MDSRRAQRLVAKATERRGYHAGWRDDQFIARQVAKLQEELAEMAQHMSDNRDYGDEGTDLEFQIQQAGKKARQIFDTPLWWETSGFKDGERSLDAVRREATDCMVVLLNIAATLNEISESPFDIVEAAVEKAQADIKRGVRTV